MTSAIATPPTWDIFCRVVDNFGDAGVCWRLARQLQREHGIEVRLWIDDLNTLRALHPPLDPALPVQQAAGISVRLWNESAAADAAVVIEAFGCGLPEALVAGMAARERPPLWIVLEYLSAESWVAEHHGLSSPHPRLALPRYFFFPGFAAQTGGLLREADLLTRRQRFGAAERAAFWRRHGYQDEGRLTVSLFAYDHAPLAALLEALEQGGMPTVLAVPEGALLRAARTLLGADAGATAWRRGALELRALPFLPQAGYDELLWACDLNFVRGEDSFVRAQWAGLPMVWQPYRQQEDAHRVKMDAFLDLYCHGLAPQATAAVRGFCRQWSAGEGAGIAAAWTALLAARSEWAAAAARWPRELLNSGEMAAKLVEFARSKVE